MTALERILKTPLKAKGRAIQVAADGYAVAAVNAHMNDVEAYAEMFSAAPDLFKSVRKLISQIEASSAWEDAENGEDAELVADVAAARAALEMAKGTAQ